MGSEARFGYSMVDLKSRSHQITVNQGLPEFTHQYQQWTYMPYDASNDDDDDQIYHGLSSDLVDEIETATSMDAGFRSRSLVH